MTKNIAKVSGMPLLRSVSLIYRAGHVVEQHSHPWAQLIYSSRGAIHVLSGQNAWLIPPTRAVFVPSGITHSLKMRGASALRTIYVPEAACDQLPAICTGLDVTALLRELILEVCSLGVVFDGPLRHRLAAGLLVEELGRCEPLRLVVTMPKDRRAHRAAQMIWSKPAEDTDLNHVACLTGASTRTLQRVFIKETGLRFTQWRQTVRMLIACSELLDGRSVTEAGLSVGYNSSSAFIAAFRDHTGTTPLRYKQRHSRNDM